MHLEPRAERFSSIVSYLLEAEGWIYRLIQALCTTCNKTSNIIYILQIHWSLEGFVTELPLCSRTELSILLLWIKNLYSTEMKGKLSSAVTASPLIVWFCGFSTLINVLTNSFESLQPYPFYDIIADPIKRTKQIIFLMEWKPSRSLWNYNFLPVSGRKHTALTRARRQRGSRQPSSVSGRNSSMAKEPAEMGWLNVTAQSPHCSALSAPLATKTGHGHFCQQGSAETWDRELLCWKFKIWQDRNDFYRFQRCFPTSWAPSCTEELPWN